MHNITLTAELRDNKDSYMNELQTENRAVQNDNWRLRNMVHALSPNPNPNPHPNPDPDPNPNPNPIQSPNLTQVHMFHKVNPSLCPGCRAGPSAAPLCKACNHILEAMASEAYRPFLLLTYLLCMQVCKLCHSMSVRWHSSNRCIHMQGKGLLSRRSRRPASTQRRAAYQSKPAGPEHAQLCFTPTNSEEQPHHPIGTATR